MKKIEQPIVGYEVARKGGAKPPAPGPEAALELMHEAIDRPEVLIGATYKLKPPSTASEHALYITINDVLLNPGTEHEQRHPYEIFINSKNMDHFQWIVALTRIVSAVFRKGGNCAFLAEELRSVFDPRGGYFKRGGRYMPSLVAEIGEVIETHLQQIGLLETEALDAHQRALLAEKRAQYEAQGPAPEAPGYPANAQLCPKCQTRAAILMDGCLACLACGYSKCG